MPITKKFLPLIFLLSFSAFAASLTSNQLRTGLSAYSFPMTIATLSNDTSNDEEMWYWLNLARLQQSNGDFKASIQSYEKAYAILDEYENRATISVRNIGSFLGSSFLSKGSEHYHAKGYERSLMHTLNALNYTMLGNFEGAAVEMRRMEQRQEFWLIESEEKIKDAADEKRRAERQGNDVTSIPSGYSMGSLLEDPDVRSMANNYQDPFSYTLSSIILDISGLSAAAGDASAISLKRALALNPDVSKVFVKSSTLPLIKSSGMEITLIVLSGEAPAMKIERVRFPIFHAAEYTSLDLPSYTLPINDLSSLSISTSTMRLHPPRLLKSNVMAYKTLKDELPSDLAKGVVRATTRAVTAKQITDKFGPLGGLIASLSMDLGSSYVDQDYRNWELLPNSGYITKFETKKGETLDIMLNQTKETIILPTDKKGAVILVDYLTPDNIRIHHVTY
ncbi:hypothetical protein B649_06405 [Candidatus Sulfuricurvum sp. RIFRC-1]|nr:hypothetical protein B649_06405 [Candidatus Sulfuricurvum sp. RIFRC-1]OHD88786.1 MAG: hypothetical protein A3G19_11575 [Sulfuricurvum sp. RIFCSPLOWO2_12_FULL_43_24]